MTKTDDLRFGTAGGRRPLRAAPASARDNDGHAGTRPAAPGFTLNAYRLLTRLIGPTTPLLLAYRKRNGKEDPNRLYERMGRPSAARPPGRLIWIHAASVGETNAILPLIDQLRTHRPDLKVLLTTGTTTSAKIAEQRLGSHGIHQYAPWDAPQYVAAFLDHWRPDVLILTESEIWPNLIMDCHARQVPIALINARMSDRSRVRWRRNKHLARPLFNRMRLVLAQNEPLARDFSKLGASDARAVGNLKIDSPPLPVDPVDQAALQAAIGQRPVWIAASTHPGEDDIVIAAHKRIASAHPDMLTIIAPRHPDRGSEIATLADAAHLSMIRRSTGALPQPDTAIYIADTIGELGLLYATVPIAFIGGSLVERGGQNPIEAIRFDTAVITGPHHGNFADAYATLLRDRGARCAETTDELSRIVTTFLDDDIEAARVRATAQAALETLSGALDRTVDALLDLLPPPGEDGNLKRAG